jgi:hypothetical protein
MVIIFIFVNKLPFFLVHLEVHYFALFIKSCSLLQKEFVYCCIYIFNCENLNIDV